MSNETQFSVPFIDSSNVDPTSFPQDVSSNALTFPSDSVQSIAGIGALPISPNPDRPGHISTGSQYGYRHFTFVFADQIANNVTTLDLNINPEDLAYETPYRVNPVQTAGGIFVDVWGQGIRKIVMRGHTGWRTQKTPTQQQDGFDNVFSLRDLIVDGYFKARSDASTTYSQTDIEDKIQLTIVDRLHQVAYRVVPENFKLLRNRMRPLLHMYEVSFIIVDNTTNTNGVPLTQQRNAVVNSKASGLLGFLKQQFSALGKQAGGIGGSFGSALGDLTNLGGGISGTFQGLLAAKQDVTRGLNQTTALVTQATQAINTGLSVVESFADFSQLAIDAKMIYSDIKSTFAQLNCILNQITHFGLYVYTGHVGSSYCGTLSSGALSSLTGVENSFATVTNSNSPNSLIVNSVNNAVTPTAQQLSKNINSVDGPALLIGRN